MCDIIYLLKKRAKSREIIIFTFTKEIEIFSEFLRIQLNLFQTVWIIKRYLIVKSRFYTFSQSPTIYEQKKNRFQEACIRTRDDIEQKCKINFVHSYSQINSTKIGIYIITRSEKKIVATKGMQHRAFICEKCAYLRFIHRN